MPAISSLYTYHIKSGCGYMWSQIATSTVKFPAPLLNLPEVRKSGLSIWLRRYSIGVWIGKDRQGECGVRGARVGRNGTDHKCTTQKIVTL